MSSVLSRLRARPLHDMRSTVMRCGVNSFDDRLVVIPSSGAERANAGCSRASDPAQLRSPCQPSLAASSPTLIFSAPAETGRIGSSPYRSVISTLRARRSVPHQPRRPRSVTDVNAADQLAAAVGVNPDALA